jgi:membrane-associated protease RseP (regulator of RpoE activity)
MSDTLKTNLLHSTLFIVTLVSTTLAGAEWTHGKSVLMEGYTWADFASGLPYSLSFLFILTVHEFGHYFTAQYYKIGVTLPYYIPLPPLPFFLGTLGALIRIKDPVQTKQQHFDIGIAGPLAGFVAAMGILFYGFTQLPPPEYIFQFHPEYERFGLDYASFVYSPEYMKPGTADVVIGKNILFTLFEKFVGDPARVPNAHEIIHYPFLFAGYLSLVFTSLNLIPIGQLDGGHVLYGLVGYKWHKRIASVIFILFILFTGTGAVLPTEPTDVLMWKVPLAIGILYYGLSALKLSQKDTIMYALVIFVFFFLMGLYFPHVQGYSGWWPFLLLVSRFVGISHPPSPIEAPLTLERKILGWVALLIFILCLTPDPLQVQLMAATEAP